MNEFKLFNVQEVENNINMLITLGREAREQHEAVERLKELNREMVGMLKDVLYYELPSDVYETINELLAKAGEVK